MSDSPYKEKPPEEATFGGYLYRVLKMSNGIELPITIIRPYTTLIPIPRKKR